MKESLKMEEEYDSTKNENKEWKETKKWKNETKRGRNEEEMIKVYFHKIMISAKCQTLFVF